MIKCMKYFVTNGRVKARVYYYPTCREYLTIYAKDYTDELWQIFGHNPDYVDNSDLVSDYFERGRVRIYADSPLYAQALARCRTLPMAPYSPPAP